MSKRAKIVKTPTLQNSDCQVSMLSESAVELLVLPECPVNIPVVDVGTVDSRIRHHVTMQLSSDYSDHEEKFECLVAPRVTAKIPSVPVNIESWNIPPIIVLADRWFNELCFQVLREAQITIFVGLPTLSEIHFGGTVTKALRASVYEAVTELSKPLKYQEKRITQKYFVQEEIHEKFVKRDHRRIESQHGNGETVLQIPLQYGPATLMSMSENLSRSNVWDGTAALRATNCKMRETTVIPGYELPKRRAIEVCGATVEVVDEPVFEKCGDDSMLQRVAARPINESAEIEGVQRKELPKRLDYFQQFWGGDSRVLVGDRLCRFELSFDTNYRLFLLRSHRVTETFQVGHEKRHPKKASSLLFEVECPSCNQTFMRELSRRSGNPEEPFGLASVADTNRVKIEGEAHEPRLEEAAIALFLIVCDHREDPGELPPGLPALQMFERPELKVKLSYPRELADQQSWLQERWLYPRRVSVIRATEEEIALNVSRSFIRETTPLPRATDEGRFQGFIREPVPLPKAAIDESTISAFGIKFQPAGVCTRQTRAFGNV